MIHLMKYSRKPGDSRAATCSGLLTANNNVMFISPVHLINGQSDLITAGRGSAYRWLLHPLVAGSAPEPASSAAGQGWSTAAGAAAGNLAADVPASAGGSGTEHAA